MSELLPCPFCGSKAYIDKGMILYAVVCDCASHVFYGCEKSKAMTVEAWNARANEIEIKHND